jgi:hypothetical protein
MLVSLRRRNPDEIALGYAQLFGVLRMDFDQWFLPWRERRGLRPVRVIVCH